MTRLVGGADEEGPVILVDGWGDASVILVDGWGDVDDVGCSLVERWCDEDGVGGCAADVSTYKITSSLLSPINYFTYDLNVKNYRHRSLLSEYLQI